MTVSTPNPASPRGPVPLAQLWTYLEAAGWTLLDRDNRSSLWRPPSAQLDDLRVVLPRTEEVTDYAERVIEALRTLSFAEKRTPEEVIDDIRHGGVDTVAVRLTPDAPSGQAPLSVAHSAISALKEWVVGSASALDVPTLVLPTRRPQRAEGFASQVRFSTTSGSFVLNLSLPVLDDGSWTASEPVEHGQQPLLEVRPQPYGRRVTLRMVAAAERATNLARQVGSGDEPIRAFGSADTSAPNATELAALAALGGPEQTKYRLRFAPSPLIPGATPTTLAVTPAEQRILGDAADFLRTRQPRTDVTVVGLVIRLFRLGAYGPGEIVIHGIDDDIGAERRYWVELAEDQYNEAVRAHGEGLKVTAVGDLGIRGTRRSLRRLRSFAVLPGLEYY